MIVTVQYLQPDKNGMLSYRRKFPKDLVRLIPSGSPTGRGRVEFKVSLRARNIDTAGAKERLAQAERDYDAIVEKARRVATGNFHRLDQPLIKYLADNYLHERLALDEAGRWGSVGVATGSSSRLQPEEDYIENRELLEAYDGEGLVAYWQGWARSYASEVGFHLSPSDPEMPSLCRALGESAVELWLALDKRTDAISIATPPAPPLPPDTKVKAASPGATEGRIGLLELFERYASTPGRNPKTIAQWRPYIRHLVNFVGTNDIQGITHDELVKWRNFLRDKHTYRGKHLSAKTINDSYMGAAQALLSWAKGDGLIRANPMREVTSVKLPAAPKTRSKGFTSDEALTILRATLVPSASREGMHLRDAKRWVPWLMAYSGARVNEMTQLRKEDVSEKDGIWVMRITPEAGRVKTNEYRLVPLHSHLIDQGFVKFVQGTAAGPLFFDPAKRRSDHAINRQSNRLGSKLATWVRSLGIDGVMPNHAWRHYFATAGARYGLDHRVSKAITGHASSNVHEKTYMSDLPNFVDVLSRELEKMPRFRVP